MGHDRAQGAWALVTDHRPAAGRRARTPAPWLRRTVRLAWRPVLLLAGALALVHGIASAWYGAFGDELYFVAAGRHLAWGYADQPPLVPWLAAALDHLAPGNLVVLRLPATLASAGHVVLAALLARRDGRATPGAAPRRRRGRDLAVLPRHRPPAGDLDARPGPVDPAALAGRALGAHRQRDLPPARRRPRCSRWPCSTSSSCPVLVAGLAVGVLVAGPRRLLGRPLLWVALVLAAASTVPTLLWQSAHGWPQLRMGAVVAGEGGLTGNRWSFLPFAAWDVGLVPGVVLAGLGLWALLRSDALRPWRAIGIGSRSSPPRR